MHELKEGDRVQMTRLGLARQNKSAYELKTETTCGKFLRYVDRFPSHDARFGKYEYAMVEWWFESGACRVHKVHAKYIEPWGTPR